MWTKNALRNLIAGKLGGVRFIVVSNREPYIHRLRDGNVECVRPASGMTTALDPILRAFGGVWIAHGSGDADRIAVDDRDRVRVPPENPSFSLRRVWLARKLQQEYYSGLSNEALWPLCHVVFERPHFEARHWQSYRAVNEIFARAVLEEAGGEPAFVFIQDYHLALLPRLLKLRGSNLITAQFWHVPWPNRETFRAFPWGEQLVQGLLGNDLLGFHLRSHCANFLETVDRSVEAIVDHEHGEVTHNGRTTLVRPFPISIDFERHSAESAGEETTAEMERWRRELGLTAEIVGIGIDRIDYTKGIPERLHALDAFFARYPRFRRRLVLVQIGVPSRLEIPAYRRLNQDLERQIEALNSKWEDGTWRPLIFLRGDFPQRRLMALHRLADFCLVTPLDDGMNLVAKEFVASRFDEAGVLILSRFAGAARELGEALLVNPFNPDEIADAIHEALTLPPASVQRRMRHLRAEVREHNIYRWAGKILSTLLKFEFPEDSGQDEDAELQAAGAER
jgi:trehalose-6-phosphate synthase